MDTTIEEALQSLAKLVAREVVSQLRPMLVELQPSRNERKDDQARVLLKPREAAKALQISERTLWNLSHTGELPCLRINRLVRYDVAVVRDWIAKAQTEPKARKRRRRSEPSDRESGEMMPHSAHEVGRRTTTRKSTRALQGAQSTAQTPTTHSLGSTANPERQSRYVLDIVADKLGVPPEALPTLTNGDIMAIADVDKITLHGWTYLGRDMPESVFDKLEQYVASWLKKSS